MRKSLDISDFINVTTTTSITEKVVERFKKRRKELKLSQQKLADKCLVSYGSIKRFEQTGEISFQSLLKLAEVLGYLDDFDALFKNSHCMNLKDIIP